MRLWLLVFLLISSQVFAQSIPLSTALSLNPPPNDSSIIFLSNIFGVVDGVLSGTGSQIFGHMMQVFNAAILGLGSIIIMYTLIVGTLNTAHEGEFLGRQWSSVWIPVRCTTGLALLIPKATGYSLIQIFTLWVIVQGVGAGDKIWTAALEYLNMGGKIIQAQKSSKDLINASTGRANTNDILYGAAAMLSGQVCMYGLQKIYEHAQQTFMDSANSSSPSGPCYNPVKSEAFDWPSFCTGTIPDFVGSVDVMKVEQDAQESSSSSPRSVQMPNFSNDNLFSFMNGKCGTLDWHAVNAGNVNSYKSDFNLNSDDVGALKNSRAIALQTMFSNLTTVAYAMVSNNPYFMSPKPNLADSNYHQPQFGVALNDNGGVCANMTQSCKDWGPLPSYQQNPVIFAGNEFNNALGAYSGLMMPILNLQYQQQYKSFYREAKSFIKETERTGWIFAGAYFLKLVNLSGSPSQQSFSTDTDSGLGDSILVSDSFPDLKTASTTDTNAVSAIASVVSISRYLTPDTSTQATSDITDKIIALSQILGAQSMSVSSRSNASSNDGYVTGYDVASFAKENSVIGFIRNSSMMNIGGQVGMQGVKGVSVPKLFSVVAPFKFPGRPGGCYGKVGIKGLFQICLFNGFVDAIWSIMSVIFNAIALVVFAILWVITEILIVIPLLIVIVPMINKAFSIINNMSMSPILDLANLGAYFIQNTLNSYLAMLAVAAIAAVIPFQAVGKIIDIIMAFMMPFYTAWLTYFLGIGFTTTFYVPMIPYVIFIFGAIAWFFLVIEAVLAAPLVALLMTSPEGEGILGNKGEQGLLLLVNLFLRPSLMIIGFIVGITMSYVNIWVLNASYSIAAEYMRASVPDIGSTFQKAGQYVKNDYNYQNKMTSCLQSNYKANPFSPTLIKRAQDTCNQQLNQPSAAPQKQGIDWDRFPFAAFMGMIFYLVLYISLYTTIVQKGFQLIALLPDKVIRWVGGSESAGQEALRWEQEVAGQIDKASKEAGVHSVNDSLTKLTTELKIGGDGGQSGGQSGSASAGPGGPPPGGGGGAPPVPPVPPVP